MDPVMIVLRSFHIIGGVLWVGAAFLFVRYIGPTAAELGPGGGTVHERPDQAAQGRPLHHERGDRRRSSRAG